MLDAVEGIKFDFNHGIRILFPRNDKIYHVTFMDIDTGVILFSSDTQPGAFITSVKKFYIRFRLIIHEKGGKISPAAKRFPPSPFREAVKPPLFVPVFRDRLLGELCDGQPAILFSANSRVSL